MISVLKWGGTPLAMGVCSNLFGHLVLLADPYPLPFLLGLLGIFLGMISILFALARVAYLRWGNAPKDFGQGAILGGLIFLGIWPVMIVVLYLLLVGLPFRT
ncbi:MAG: hypothetical protein U0P81_15750 [Holophagaceae bacterium]